MTQETGLVGASFFHVALQDGQRSKEEKNLNPEAILTRIAVPFRLNKTFRVDGFEFDPARLKRFRITRSDAPIDVAALLQGVDRSSIASAFVSMLSAAQQMTEGEDVTDDVLKQADQFIALHSLTPEKRSPFDVGIQPDKAFVVMSYAPELAQSFEAISEACAESGAKAIRADKEISSAPVMDRIVLHLKESSYVIADLTKARPNVYYEVGYFDAICEARGVDSARQLLLVAHNVGVDAHFDLKHRGIEEYDNPFTLRKIVKNWFQGLKT